MKPKKNLLFLTTLMLIAIMSIGWVHNEPFKVEPPEKNGEFVLHKIKSIETIEAIATTSFAYCAANGNNINDEFISRVQLGSIDNASQGGTGGYSDFTSISTNLTKGATATITITPTWTGQLYSEAYRVWIDYNQNDV